MLRTMVFPPSREYLNELTYRQLQTVAKRRHIPSNVKKEYLREAIYYSWRGDRARVERIIETIKAERQNRHLAKQLITRYRKYRTTAVQRSLLPNLQSLEGVNLGKDLIVSLINNQHKIEVHRDVRNFQPYERINQEFLNSEVAMRDSQRLFKNVSSSQSVSDGRNDLKICHSKKSVKNKVTQTGRIKAALAVKKSQAKPSEPVPCDRVLRNKTYPIYSKYGHKQKARPADRDENMVTSSGDFVVARSLRQTLAESVEQYGMEHHDNVQELEPLDFSVKKPATKSDDVQAYQHHALMMYSEVSHSEVQDDHYQAQSGIENTQLFYSETYHRQAENHGYQPYYHKKIRIERRMSEFNPDPLTYAPYVDTNNNVRTYPPAKIDKPPESMVEWHNNSESEVGQRQQGEALEMRQDLEADEQTDEYLSCRQDLISGGETPSYGSEIPAHGNEIPANKGVNIQGYVNESVMTYIVAPQTTVTYQFDREKPDSTVDDDGGMVYGYMTTVEPSIQVEPAYEVPTISQAETQKTEPASEVASYPLPSFVDMFKRFCKGTQTVEENSAETSPVANVEVEAICNASSQLAQTERVPAERESVSELESMACGSPWSDVGAAVTVGEPSWDDVLGLIQEQGDMTTEMDNIQCVCCDWNGGASDLEAHIREEHADQIQTYTAMLRCTHAVPLGILLRARRYTTLLQCYGRLLALVVLYRDPEWVSVGVAQVSPHGDLPLVDSTLTLYNRVTGEPFTWAGPALRSNAIFHSNPTAHLRVPLSKLGLVPNSADVLLWNRELQAASVDHKSVCGHSRFDHITFDVHVQLTC